MNLFIYLGLYTYRCYSPVSCVSGALPCLVCSFLDIFPLFFLPQSPFFLFCTDFGDIHFDTILFSQWSSPPFFFCFGRTMGVLSFSNPILGKHQFYNDIKFVIRGAEVLL